jgi:hypothetical protein
MKEGKLPRGQESFACVGARAVDGTKRGEAGRMKFTANTSLALSRAVKTLSSDQAFLETAFVDRRSLDSTFMIIC